MKKIFLILGIGLIIFGVVLYFQNKPITKEEQTHRSVPTGIKEKNILLKFVVMADIHNDTESLAKAQQMAQGELVILAGDLTINGTEKEEMAIKKSLNREVLIVPEIMMITKMFGFLEKNIKA